jgi:hypothetical protein
MKHELLQTKVTLNLALVILLDSSITLSNEEALDIIRDVVYMREPCEITLSNLTCYLSRHSRYFLDESQELVFGVYKKLLTSITRQDDAETISLDVEGD